MEQFDFKKEYKTLYNASDKVVTLVEVPPMTFLMTDGVGDPNTAPAYTTAVETLYSVTYTLKFMLKKAGVLDYGVAPLEGLWWLPEGAVLDMSHKDNWCWTMMIAQPPQVTPARLDEALQQLAAKKKGQTLAAVRLETYDEGRAVQLMHLGPYAEEGPNLRRIEEYIAANDLLWAKKHHEIYLSDPRRTAPEKLKTVLRQPVEVRG